MKRTFPLIITAVVGFVLIVSVFIPETEGWGKDAAVWFDVLAAIAFVLGGGSLLKVHLKKISDRAAGWGYSGVTLIAFLATLIIGLGKIGSQPVAKQEFYGETFAPLALEDFPESQVAVIDAAFPQQPSHVTLPLSVRRQLGHAEGKLTFRGWMLPNQKADLLKFEDELAWRVSVGELFGKAQPTAKSLQGKAFYYADHQVLAFKGVVDEEQQAALLKMSGNQQWQQAVKKVAEQSRRPTRLPIEGLPRGIAIPDSMQEMLSFDKEANELVLTGPLSASQRDLLAGQFPVDRPLTGKDRGDFLLELEKRGTPLTEKQKQAFNKVLDGIWSVAKLHSVLDEAGNLAETNKTPKEMLAEKKAGVVDIEPKKTVGTAVKLNGAQVAVLNSFASDETIDVKQLGKQLKEAGPFEDRQQAALAGYFKTVPTRGERNRMLYIAILKKDRTARLSLQQTNLLLDEYRRQFAWRQTVGKLFIAAHVPKYGWSGEYAAQGTAFWWVYEYLFKPLTATMFAMLAFYVASAAFRAFRAKNVEASLLLGTAFIILLGRTFAGVRLTEWMPESLDGLRIEVLSVYIMQVFNTAGNRAIMIGIALGIASTSLKVLLGVDRSYLGSADD